jgi:4-oxalocrotonate tautomerase
MPHVVIKLLAGRPEANKQHLVDAVTQAVVASVDCTEDAVSVDIQAVGKSEWADQVYAPEIAPHLDRLYKKPGYRLA